MWYHKGDKAASKNNPAKVGRHGWPDSRAELIPSEGLQKQWKKLSEIEAKV